MHTAVTIATPLLMTYKLLYTALFVLLTGCAQYAYFQTPMQGISHTYKEIPIKSSGVSSALYGGATISTAALNDQLRDNIAAFQGTVYRSHNFSSFQAHYGLTGMLGKYRVAGLTQAWLPGSLFYNESLNDSLITSRSGSQFTGALGAAGGINLVMPTRKGEWRVIGTEFTWTREFGKYYRFRKDLPDTAANMIDKNASALFVSLHTDVVWRTRYGSAGLKFAVVANPRSIPGYLPSRYPASYSSGYFANTFHISGQRVAGYFQYSMGGKCAGMSAGASYLLSKR